MFPINWMTTLLGDEIANAADSVLRVLLRMTDHPTLFCYSAKIDSVRQPA
jgi:hypothetical protein